ncbi:MAG: hypothetical protein CMM25_06185 [Rhodospirillaceae bacterium]|nr:hypothetical protein [Rhodospirillaceae bacterium]
MKSHTYHNHHQQRTSKKNSFSQREFLETSGNAAAPYYDDIEAHLHIWKPARVINGGEAGQVLKFEQVTHAEYLDNKKPIDPTGHYCSICHCSKPPVFKMRSVDKRDEVTDADWCNMYNAETRRLENQKPYVEKKNALPSPSVKATNKIREAVGQEYWENIPELWNSGKYELVQFYLRRMHELGIPGTLDKICQAENKLWNIQDKRSSIVNWGAIKYQRDAFIQAIVEKATRGTQMEWTETIDDKPDAYTRDLPGELLTLPDGEERDLAMIKRQEIRESMMDGVGELQEPTYTSRSIMKGASQNRPGKRIKPSIFLPKTGNIKVTHTSTWNNQFEDGMLIVEKVENKWPTGARVIHEGAKYRPERKVRVEMIEDDRKLLEVA